MKIRNQLYISAGISIILIIILAASVFITSNLIEDKNNKHDLALSSQQAISELNIITNEYLLHHEKRMEQQWNAQYNSVANILRKAEEEEEEEEEEDKRLVESIRSNYIELGRLFLQITRNYNKEQSLLKTNVSEEKIATVVAVQERLLSQLSITSQSIIADSSQLAKTTQARADAIQKVSNTIIFTLMLIVAVLIAATSLFVIRSITKPLSKLLKGTEIIGKGNIKHKIDISGNNEFSQLGTAFNKMVADLKSNIAKKQEIEKEKRKETERSKKELQKKVDELERWKKVTLARELRIKELKLENVNLKQQDDKKDIEDKKDGNWSI